MAHAEAFNAHARHGPQLLGPPSEPEKRDRAAGGATHPGIAAGEQARDSAPQARKLW